MNMIVNPERPSEIETRPEIKENAPDKTPGMNDIAQADANAREQGQEIIAQAGKRIENAQMAA